MIELLKSAGTSIKDALTETDGSWCLGRTLALLAGSVMVYKFARATQSDYQSFAIGISAIIASLAAKNYGERFDKKDAKNA